MRQEIMTALEGAKGRAGYYGITPRELAGRLGIAVNGVLMSTDELMAMQREGLIIVSTSSQVIDRGALCLICKREN